MHGQDLPCSDAVIRGSCAGGRTRLRVRSGNRQRKISMMKVPCERTLHISLAIRWKRGVGLSDRLLIAQSNFTAGIHRVELASHGAREPSRRVFCTASRKLAGWHWGKFSWSARRATLPGLEVTNKDCSCSGTSKGKLANAPHHLCRHARSLLQSPLRHLLVPTCFFHSSSLPIHPPPASGLRTRLVSLWRHGPVVRLLTNQ